MNARRMSGQVVVLGSAVVMLLAQPTHVAASLAPGGAVSAQEQNLSAFGTARIDGVIRTGEWDRAGRIDFALAIPTHDGGGSVQASIYVMNDARNLYVAVKGPGSYGAFNPAFEFDNDNDGRWPEEGDDVFLANASQDQPIGPLVLTDDFRGDCPGDVAGSLGCGAQDTDATNRVPGANDGVAAGFSSSDRKGSFVEMSHPLDSGDDAHDFSLRAGSVVGFFVDMRVISAGGGPECGWPECFGDTRFPSAGFVHFQVASATSAPTAVPEPVASGSWSARISGAGISGVATLEVPAVGWATSGFSLYHLKSHVAVAARIVAGTACDATATTITTLPGYTTTNRGTWRQRWVFDGASLARLRSAIRAGTQLWFGADVGGSSVCRRLI
jgi:hypothetical protein